MVGLRDDAREIIALQDAVFCESPRPSDLVKARRDGSARTTYVVQWYAAQ